MKRTRDVRQPAMMAPEVVVEWRHDPATPTQRGAWNRIWAKLLAPVPEQGNAPELELRSGALVTHAADQATPAN
jgi:hypothetical protein